MEHFQEAAIPWAWPYWAVLYHPGPFCPPSKLTRCLRCRPLATTDWEVGLARATDWPALMSNEQISGGSLAMEVGELSQFSLCRRAREGERQFLGTLLISPQT